MPSEFGPDEAPGAVRIAVAPVLDFQFGLFLLCKHILNPEKSVPQWAADAVAEQRPLVERMMTFWEGPGLADVTPGNRYREWGELLVAGWYTDTLLSPDVPSHLRAAAEVFASGFEVPPLDSEPEDVRALIARRVDYLSRHAVERAEYLALVADAWALIQPRWDRDGRAAAQRAAQDLAAKAKQDPDLRVLVPGNTYLHKEQFSARIYDSLQRHELVVVPLGLAGGGQFYWAFPGLVLLGAGVDSAEREAQRRERSERAANRLKVLSDPTRVALLHELLRGSAHHTHVSDACNHPSTVTELASLFGLSQPTVSVHVKMLREAALIRAERDGNQIYYHAEESVVRAYVASALDDILGLTASHSGEPADIALALSAAGVRPGF